MGVKEIERRLCQRFKIPGATVSYRITRLFSPKSGNDEEFCPILDLSRGGIRFLTQKPLKFKSKVTIQLSIPGERVPIDLKGRVRWSTFNAGKSYKYQAGVQINPYGLEKHQNVPQTLTKIVALESKFIEPEEPSDPSKPGEFGA
ncbi:MAG: PilZ domain-containing protein [Candidatus Aminicenantes bacterium]|nr:PilZ domain-containing protein [Candidatus Aminicenantes bacterium]